MKGNRTRLLAALLSLSLVLGGCGGGGSSSSGGSGEPETPAVSSSGSAGVPEQSPPAPPPEPVVSHLMVAGDVMSHLPITQEAYVEATGEYDFSPMLADIVPQLEQGDYALANLETPLAGGPEYSGYPCFNAPDALAADVKEAGFDLVATANNHTRDQGMEGICRTLDVVEEAGLQHVGTCRTLEEREASRGVVVADVGGISVAFLCYTYGLNGFQIDPELWYTVNLFNTDYTTTLCTPDYDLLTGDLEAARAMDTDLIAVIVHWGIEYRDAATDYQQEMARFFVEQGADLVLGGHPHVLEPMETLTVTGWDGRQRQGFVIYSLGNLLSNQYRDDPQQDLAVKTTAILDLELTKDPATGDSTLTDVCYTPYFMLHRDEAAQGERRRLVNIHRAMAACEGGDTSLVDEEHYASLTAALEHCHAILGAEGDRSGAGT